MAEIEQLLNTLENIMKDKALTEEEFLTIFTELGKVNPACFLEHTLIQSLYKTLSSQLGKGVLYFCDIKQRILDTAYLSFQHIQNQEKHQKQCSEDSSIHFKMLQSQKINQFPLENLQTFIHIFHDFDNCNDDPEVPVEDLINYAMSFSIKQIEIEAAVKELLKFLDVQQERVKKKDLIELVSETEKYIYDRFNKEYTVSSPGRTQTINRQNLKNIPFFRNSNPLIKKSQYSQQHALTISSPHNSYSSSLNVSMNDLCKGTNNKYEIEINNDEDFVIMLDHFNNQFTQSIKLMSLYNQEGNNKLFVDNFMECQEQIKIITSKAQQLMESFQALKINNEQQTKEKQELTTSFNFLRHNLEDLLEAKNDQEAKIELLQNDNERLQQELTKVEKKNQIYIQQIMEISSLETLLQQLQREIAHLQDQLKKEQNKSEALQKQVVQYQENDVMQNSGFLGSWTGKDCDINLMDREMKKSVIETYCEGETAGSIKTKSSKQPSFFTEILNEMKFEHQELQQHFNQLQEENMTLQCRLQNYEQQLLITREECDYYKKKVEELDNTSSQNNLVTKQQVSQLPSLKDISLFDNQEQPITQMRDKSTSLSSRCSKLSTNILKQQSFQQQQLINPPFQNSREQQQRHLSKQHSQSISYMQNKDTYNFSQNSKEDNEGCVFNNLKKISSDINNECADLQSDLQSEKPKPINFQYNLSISSINDNNNNDNTSYLLQDKKIPQQVNNSFQPIDNSLIIEELNQQHSILKKSTSLSLNNNNPQLQQDEPKPLQFSAISEKLFEESPLITQKNLENYSSMDDPTFQFDKQQYKSAQYVSLFCKDSDTEEQSNQNQPDNKKYHENQQIQHSKNNNYTFSDVSFTYNSYNDKISQKTNDIHMSTPKRKKKIKEHMQTSQDKSDKKQENQINIAKENVQKNPPYYNKHVCFQTNNDEPILQSLQTNQYSQDFLNLLTDDKRILQVLLKNESSILRSSPRFDQSKQDLSALTCRYYSDSVFILGPRAGKEKMILYISYYNIYIIKLDGQFTIEKKLGIDKITKILFSKSNPNQMIIFVHSFPALAIESFRRVDLNLYLLETCKNRGLNSYQISFKQKIMIEKIFSFNRTQVTNFFSNIKKSLLDECQINKIDNSTTTSPERISAKKGNLFYLTLKKDQKFIKEEQEWYFASFKIDHRGFEIILENNNNDSEYSDQNYFFIPYYDIDLNPLPVINDLDYNYTFKITNKSTQDQYLFCALSQIEYEQWYYAFNNYFQEPKSYLELQ